MQPIANRINFALSDEENEDSPDDHPGNGHHGDDEGSGFGG